MEFLKIAGIDTDTFNAYSTIYASTSNAKALGVSITDIVKKGQWTSDSMFRQRYCKDVILNSECQFQKRLFAKALNEDT